MKKLVVSLAILACLAIPASVKADELTFLAPPTATGCTSLSNGLRCTPTPADMDDLDHHSVYTWRIDNVQLGGQTITGARITFTNIANWDTNPNRLFAHLLDTARNSGVRQFLDDNPNNSPVTSIVDDFVNTRFHNGTNALGQSSPWLVAPGTADTHLFDQSFTMTPTTFVYNFTASELQALIAYIANGGNFAIGLDPDCHFFNDGIKLEIFTANAPVPEPATLTLLGTGLAGLYYRRRRRQQAARDAAA